MTKHCNKCNIIKDSSEFYKRRNRKNGLRSQCKNCCKIDRKLSYIQDTKNIGKKELNLRLKKWIVNNRETSLKFKKQFRKKHKTSIRTYNKEYERISRKLLSNKYIKALLTDRCDLKSIDISDEMVELKRTQLKLVRAIKDE